DVDVPRQQPGRRPAAVGDDGPVRGGGAARRGHTGSDRGRRRSRRAGRPRGGWWPAGHRGGRGHIGSRDAGGDSAGHGRWCAGGAVPAGEVDAMTAILAATAAVVALTMTARTGWRRRRAALVVRRLRGHTRRRGRRSPANWRADRRYDDA